MSWFGRLDDAAGTWEMDVDAVIREVGLGILRAYRVRFPRIFREGTYCTDESQKWIP